MLIVFVPYSFSFIIVSQSLSDPLNYGFYMPPFKGKSGKFLSEERLLRDYPAEGYGDHLEVFILIMTF